jgi:hypothetical protein
MGIDEKIHKALSQHVPKNAVDYCWALWKESPFHFFITNIIGVSTQFNF